MYSRTVLQASTNYVSWAGEGGEGGEKQRK